VPAATVAAKCASQRKHAALLNDGFRQGARMHYCLFVEHHRNAVASLPPIGCFLPRPSVSSSATAARVYTLRQAK
jgi:hypothetical protein